MSEWLASFGRVSEIVEAPIPVRPPDTRTVEEVRDEVRRQAALHAGEALEVLVETMRTTDNERVRRECAVAILDRGGVISMPAQSLVNVNGANVNVLVQINQRRAAREVLEG